MKTFKPTVVLGTGGYAAAPALAAAVLKKIPIVIHEPDSHPGLVNKVFAKYAKIISLGMASAEAKFKTLINEKTNAFTQNNEPENKPVVNEPITNKQSKNKQAIKIIVNGNPVAQRFLNLPTRETACEALELNPHLPVILVTGGSQGAQTLNKAVYEMLSLLAASSVPFQILHQVGEKNWTEMENTLNASLRNHPLYKARKYFDDLSLAYAACNLAICRSGAMTVAELAVTGTPAIFVPYPYAAANHQTFNANFIASTGAAKVIMQTELSGKLSDNSKSSENKFSQSAKLSEEKNFCNHKLYNEIEQLLTNPAQLSQMREHMLSLAKPQAAYMLTEQLLNLS